MDRVTAVSRSLAQLLDVKVDDGLRKLAQQSLEGQASHVTGSLSHCTSQEDKCGAGHRLHVGHDDLQLFLPPTQPIARVTFD